MSENVKFFEKRMHEREMPNKNGQYRRGMKYGYQDWYGNELVFHKERTYFGNDLTSVNPEELTDNPKTVFDYLDNQVREFLKRLAMIVPDAALNLDALQVFIKRKYGHPDVNRGNAVYTYEDDGNTRTEGFHFNIYWVLPLSNRNEFLESAVQDGYVRDAIVFKLEFDERIHDSEISSRFFSLYFYGVMSEEVHGEKINPRIDYNNDNMTMNSIINPENLFRVGKKLIEYKQDESLLAKARLAFEQ